MEIAQLLVTLGGLGLLVLVAWFFFGAPHRADAVPTTTVDAQQAVNQAPDSHSLPVAEARESPPA